MLSFMARKCYRYQLFRSIEVIYPRIILVSNHKWLLIFSQSETFGQVYLEAMACGVPVVAARGSQMGEFFEEGVHGFTWTPGDVESAVNALNRAIERQQRPLSRQVWAQKCRDNAITHSWSNATKQIADVYIMLTKKQVSGWLIRFDINRLERDVTVSKEIIIK